MITFKRHGTTLTIRKVETGGYERDGFDFDDKVVAPHNIYYSIAKDGRRLDAALTLAGARRMAEGICRKLLK